MKNNRGLLFILILSIVLRWISYNYFLSHLISPADSGQYIAIAENLTNGKGFSLDGNEPTFHRAPFLPYFLSLLLLTSKNNWHLIASAANILISSITGVVVYFTSMRIINDGKIAIISSLLFAINPVSIFWSGFILTEPFFLLFFTLSILYLLKAADGQKMRDFVICGVLIGFSALTRPVILGVIPFIALWVLIFKNRSFAEQGIVPQLMKFTMTGIFFVLTILPWTIRNYVNSGEIIPITSEGHGNLIQGLTEDPKTLEQTPIFTPEEINNMEHLNDWEYRGVERERVIQYVLSHPRDVLRLMIKKVFMFWSLIPEVNSTELRSDFFIKLLMVLWATYSGVIYIFAIVGFFSVKGRNNIMLIIFIMISFTIMHMFFLVVPEKRFRLPLEPYLVILAAAGLYSPLERKILKLRGPLSMVLK
ncbi:MAG: glycosyltransferase family 39 protein [Nitrospinae bacterium]|nr:glycosyltransferase family 39 protein [Nitrospinota bacterium]